MRFEGLDDFPVQGFVRAVEAEMIPQDGDVHECPARFEYATDFRQRGIDVGDVFQRLGGGCGVWDASSRPVSSASLSRNEILVNSPHAVSACR